MQTFSCTPLAEPKTVKLHVVTPTGSLGRGAATLALTLGRGTDVCSILVNFLHRALGCADQCLAQVVPTKTKTDSLVFTLTLQKSQVRAFETFLDANKKRYEWHMKEPKTSSSALTSLLAGAVGTGVGVALGSTASRGDAPLLAAVKEQTRVLQPIATQLAALGRTAEQLTGLGETAGMLQELVETMQTELRGVTARTQLLDQRQRAVESAETKLRADTQAIDRKAQDIEEKVSAQIQTTLAAVFTVNPLTKVLEHEAFLQASVVTQPTVVTFQLQSELQTIKDEVREFSNRISTILQKVADGSIMDADVEAAAKLYNTTISPNMTRYTRNYRAAKQNAAEILAYKEWNLKKTAFLTAVAVLRQNPDVQQKLATAQNLLLDVPPAVPSVADVPEQNRNEVMREVITEIKKSLDLIAKAADVRWEILLAWEKGWGIRGTIRGTPKTFLEKMEAWDMQFQGEQNPSESNVRALRFIKMVFTHFRAIFEEFRIPSNLINFATTV